jgi:hypothetical protein
MNQSERHETAVIGARALPGELVVPANTCGLVVFAHGSGSSRLSSRNIYVAGELQARGLATLLFDLLTEPEAKHSASCIRTARRLRGRAAV